MDVAPRVAAPWVAALLAFGLAPSARAQSSAPPSYDQLYAFDTGSVAAPRDEAAITIGFRVDVPGASWLRLFFSDVELGRNGKLRILSLADGALQELDGEQLRQWHASSAYFNGDQLWVEVLSEPGTRPSRVRLERVTVGVPPPHAFTICGATDDRVLSSDPRSARALPVGCTAFLIQDCGHGFLMAGHCASGGTDVLEFNVPPSTSTGAMNHPPPSDQYSVDPASVQYHDAVIGDDWCYFGCFANATTGLTAFAAQHAAFAPAVPPAAGPSVLLRVTGYGSDATPPEADYVEQTSTGPYVGLAGTTLQHQVDTTGGSSGSCIEWDQVDVAIGIHTNGGCDAGGVNPNLGTALTNANLLSALVAPSGVLACANPWSTYCLTKVNSHGCVPAIGATGTPSVSGGPGSFTIAATNVLSNQSGIFVYGLAPASTPFQGGLLCIAGSIRRTTVQNAGGNPPPADCTGSYAYDMGARIASGVDSNLHAGATVVGQFWSRDPQSSSYPSGLTNAIRFTIGP